MQQTIKNSSLGNKQSHQRIAVSIANMFNNSTQSPARNRAGDFF